MGRYFDAFRAGESFVTPARTITETDLVMYAGLTGDYNPLHTDEVFASQTSFEGRIAHGPMFVGLAFGLLSRLDLFDGTALALKGIQWQFLGPVRPGDTVHLRANVENLSAHPSKADRGDVTLGIEFVNQDDAVVQKGTVTIVVQRDVAIP